MADDEQTTESWSPESGGIAHSLADLGIGAGRLIDLRVGLIAEIERREKELTALRAKLSGVEMVIGACADAD